MVIEGLNVSASGGIGVTGGDLQVLNGNNVTVDNGGDVQVTHGGNVEVDGANGGQVNSPVKFDVILFSLYRKNKRRGATLAAPLFN